MKQTIFKHLTDAIGIITVAKGCYDKEVVSEYPTIQAIDSAILELKVAKLLLEKEMQK